MSKDITQKIAEDEFSCVEDIELELLLQALFWFHGYDFRDYARKSIKRQVKALLKSRSLPNISCLIPLLAHNPDEQTKIISDLTVSYSMLFRDPLMYKQLQETVFPYLASFPRLNIWITGCANGEEVYSLAILLDEANLLERTQIYATDISQKALARASSGILSRPLDAEIATRYRSSSGKYSLSDYFTSAYGKQKLKQSLLKKIHFAEHNLLQQPSFITAELILCRNMLIYFNKKFRQLALSNLKSALIDKGYLVIGSDEGMESIAEKKDWLTVDMDSGIYQKPLHFKEQEE